MIEASMPTEAAWDLLWVYARSYSQPATQSPAESLLIETAAGTPTLSIEDERRIVQREAAIRHMRSHAALKDAPVAVLDEAESYLAGYPSLRDPKPTMGIYDAIRFDCQRAEDEARVLARLKALRAALSEDRALVDDPFAEPVAA